MKRFIVTSAALMCAALLYGAVDFMISKNHGDLTGLYRETPNREKQRSVSVQTAPAPAGVKFNFVNEPRTISVATNKETEKLKNKKNAKREIKLEEYSRAALEDAVAEEEVENDSVHFSVVDHSPPIQKTAIPSWVHVIDSFASVPVKVNAVKQKRKISSDKFSRAPLRAEPIPGTLVLNDSIK
jgi:hypothetical protein